jgi:hypothetical protein
MHPSNAADNLENLVTLISSILNSSPTPAPTHHFQATLARIQNREPEILIQLLGIKNPRVQMATSAVLSDLLLDHDPLIRQNTMRFLLTTRSTAYLRLLVEYLQQVTAQDEIRSAARITAHVACSGRSLTSACVQHNAVLAWRLMSLLNGMFQGSKFP